MKKNNDIWILAEGAGERISGVSHELLNRALPLAAATSGRIRAVILGEAFSDETLQKLIEHGADSVIAVEHPALKYFSADLYARCLCDVIARFQPPALIAGATLTGRTLMPYAAMICGTGLTADCTSLEIGDYKDAKTGKEYTNLLYQIRPAFGGNIVATIVNPECRPQMATVREGVMRKEIRQADYQGEVKRLDADAWLEDADLVVRVIERQMEKSKVNLKAAPIIVSGGYGVGSKENFGLLYELAEVLGAEVGASRAAVDAGFCEHERQIGQTGTTVRPKLYIACGISGQIQHTAGMEESSMVISINTDPNAPITKFADYAITGDLNVVIPKMIQYYKKNSK